MPNNRSKGRWQFSLGTLFAAITVAAFVSAAMAGALGVAVEESVMSLATILLVVGAGIIYYVLFILVLCSPVFFAILCLKIAARMIARRAGTPREDPSQSSAEPADLNP